MNHKYGRIIIWLIVLNLVVLTIYIVNVNHKRVFRNNILLPGGSTQIPDQIFPSLNLSFNDTVFYGHKISMPGGLFFSYNVNTKEKKSAPFRPKKFAAKYSGYEYPFFYFNKPIVNSVENRIVTGMKYFNEVYFYDLDLNPLKTIAIGNKTLPGLFNNATVTNESYIHTVDMCATDTYIYILYDRRMEKEYDNSTGGTSFIIILDWEGNHIESFIIRRSSIISVDPTNSYLLAFSRDDPSGSAFYKYHLNF